MFTKIKKIIYNTNPYVTWLAAIIAIMTPVLAMMIITPTKIKMAGVCFTNQSSSQITYRYIWKPNEL